jgi:GeoRSP system SPASM domain protein
MELATPITIYWDLPSGPADARLFRICDEIIACRPLMLHLSDPGPGIGEGTIELLHRLKETPIAVSLTIQAPAQDGAATMLRDSGLKEILLALEHPEDILSSRREWGLDGNGPNIGVSFKVTGENWRKLPMLAVSCRTAGTVRLVLPMQRLYDGETPFLLTREEQRELTDALAVAGGVRGLDLTVHDPFLWRAVNPGVPFPQGGCQAANTMLAIAPDGRVYPCPTLPVPLGDAGKEPLREIVTSPGKRELRRRLLESPGGCRGCGELAVCRGGCRGRSYVIHGSLEGADSACR